MILQSTDLTSLFFLDLKTSAIFWSLILSIATKYIVVIFSVIKDFFIYLPKNQHFCL